MIRSLPKSQSHAGPWRAGSLCRVVQSTRLALLIALASAAPAAPLAAQCADGSPPPCARPATRSGPPAANSVAILFFDARDTADAYLAEGLTEDLTSLLGSVARVQVKSPGVVRRAQRASPGDAPAIARALGVRYLVDGNVRRVGTRVRVATRLVNGATAVAAWGDVFDRTAEDLLGLPSVIAREVATRVGGPAPSSEASALGTLRTPNAAAYDHFLRGNFFLALRPPEGITRALPDSPEAERLDSGFAAAIGRAAYAYAIARGNYYPLPDAPLESLVGRGLGVADPALRRDSTSSDAWMARGFLLPLLNPPTMAGSLEAFWRAIPLDPKNAEAHHQYAQVLNWPQRHDEARPELHLASTPDPGRAVSYLDLANTHFRETALALALIDSATALDPASPLARWWRAYGRPQSGDVRRAQDDAHLAKRRRPRDVLG